MILLNIRVVKNVREGTAVAVPFHNIYYTMYTLHLLTGVQAFITKVLHTIQRFSVDIFYSARSSFFIGVCRNNRSM